MLHKFTQPEARNIYCLHLFEALTRQMIDDQLLNYGVHWQFPYLGAFCPTDMSHHRRI